LLFKRSHTLLRDIDCKHNGFCVQGETGEPGLPGDTGIKGEKVRSVNLNLLI